MNSAETHAHAAWGIMVSQERRDQFVAALRTLGGSAGNGRLREQLGWEDDEYRAVHAALTQDGTVVPGRGRGGSVSLSTTWVTTPPPADHAPVPQEKPLPAPPHPVVLRNQAAANTKEQFVHSPALPDELMNAIMDTMAVHQSMSRQALNSDAIRAAMLATMLAQGGLWEAFRQRSDAARHA